MQIPTSSTHYENGNKCSGLQEKCKKKIKIWLAIKIEIQNVAAANGQGAWGKRRWDSGRLLGNLCGGMENGENGKYATVTWHTDAVGEKSTCKNNKQLSNVWQTRQGKRQNLPTTTGNKRKKLSEDCILWPRINGKPTETKPNAYQIAHRAWRLSNFSY